MNIYDTLWEILRDTVFFSCRIKTWDCFVGELLWFHVSFWLCLLQSALRLTSFQTMNLPLKISSFLSNLLPLLGYELEDKQSKLEQEKKILLSCVGTGCLGVKSRSVISFYVNSAGIFFTLPGALLSLPVGAFASLNTVHCVHPLPWLSLTIDSLCLALHDQVCFDHCLSLSLIEMPDRFSIMFFDHKDKCNIGYHLLLWVEK